MSLVKASQYLSNNINVSKIGRWRERGLHLHTEAADRLTSEFEQVAGRWINGWSEKASL